MDENMDIRIDVDTSDVDVGDDIDISDVSEDVPEEIPEDVLKDSPTEMNGVETDEQLMNTALSPDESEWNEEDQQLWDNDFNSINEDTIDYDNPGYIKDGIIKPAREQELIGETDDLDSNIPEDVLKNSSAEMNGAETDVQSMNTALSPDENEWNEENQQLWDNDFGAINEDAIDYDNSGYIKDGMIKPDWGKESVDDPEQAVLPEGTRIVQYSHPGRSGVHFAPEGTKYEDLQLPDSQDKRVQNVYEVQEGGLSVDSSEVAFQPWNKTNDMGKGTGARQFVSNETADVLVKRGKLKPVSD